MACSSKKMHSSLGTLQHGGRCPASTKQETEKSIDVETFPVVSPLVRSVGHLLAKGRRHGMASNWWNACWVGSLVRRKTCPSCPVVKWADLRCFVNELLVIAGFYIPSLAFPAPSISWHPTVKPNTFIWKYIWKGFQRAQSAAVVLWEIFAFSACCN